MRALYAILVGTAGAVVDKHVFFDQQPRMVENPKTLVLSDPELEVKETHARFLAGFAGHEIVMGNINEKNTFLFRYVFSLHVSSLLCKLEKDFEKKTLPATVSERSTTLS